MSLEFPFTTMNKLENELGSVQDLFLLRRDRLDHRLPLCHILHNPEVDHHHLDIVALLHKVITTATTAITITTIATIIIRICLPWEIDSNHSHLHPIMDNHHPIQQQDHLPIHTMALLPPPEELELVLVDLHLPTFRRKWDCQCLPFRVDHLHLPNNFNNYHHHHPQDNISLLPMLQEAISVMWCVVCREWLERKKEISHCIRYLFIRYYCSFANSVADMFFYIPPLHTEMKWNGV